MTIASGKIDENYRAAVALCDFRDILVKKRSSWHS